MHDGEKSDRPIVPAKRPNDAERQAEEAVEGRGRTHGNSDRTNTHRTQNRERVPSGLERVREVARRDKKTRFTALLHHVTFERLGHAYEGLNPKATPGVDGVTWHRYAAEAAE